MADPNLIQRAIAKQKGLPYDESDLPPPEFVPDQVPPAQVAAPPPNAMPLRTIMPADAPVLRTIEPQAAVPAMPESQSAPDVTLPPQPTGVDGMVGAIGDLSEQQAQSAMRVGDQEAASEGRQSKLADEYQRDVADISARHNDRYQAADEMYRRTMGEYRDMNDAVARLPPIKASSPGVWGALSLIGSGFSEGLSGGTNDAVNQQRQAIDKRIQRDVELQQQNYNNKRQNAQAKLTEVGVARQYMGDTEDATRFALGLRRERFGAAMEAEAHKLKSATARERALQAASQYRLEGKQMQVNAMKSFMGGKMSALEAAMLVKLGVLTPEQARAQMGMGANGAAGDSPASLVPGKISKQAASKLNVDTYQNDVPGVEWLVDPSKVTTQDRENVQKIKSAADRVTATVRKAKEAYMAAADPQKSDQERLEALGRYRNLVYSQLPGFVSQATGSGTPQEGEAQRLLTSLPPVPVVNDVANVRGTLQSIENWRNDRTMSPAGFDYFAQDFGDIVNSGMSAFKGRLRPEGAAGGAPKASSGGTPKPKPKAGGAKPDLSSELE